MTVSPPLHRSRGVGRTPADSPLELRSEQLNDDDESIMTKGPDGVVRKLKDRLRAICKRRRIRLQDFFEQFDVHHNKKVSKGQFRRALDQAGVTVPTTGGGPPTDLLSTKEVEMLIKRYQIMREGFGDESDVNYWKLCEQVEKVFTRRGLEKNPTMDVKLSLENCPESKYGVSHPGLSPEEAVIVAGLLSRVRLFVSAEGLVVKALFKTFDKRNNGTVTASIFRRQLDSMFKGKLSKVEARLLLRAYQMWDGAANYRAMHIECSDYIGVAATTTPALVPVVTENDLQNRRGELSPSSAISSLGAEVRHSSCGAGEDQNDRDTDSVVNSVTGLPTGRPKVPRPDEDRSWGRDEEAGTAEAAPGDRWLPIEHQMASKVAYHRLRLEDAYTPYDYNSSGTVTRAVFRQGLANAFCISFSEAQLSVLEERYRSGKDQVNFRRMCEHIYAISRSAAFTGNSMEEEDYERTIAKKAIEEIGAALHRRRVSLHQEFHDFDRRGEGHVSVGQLERVLCSNGVLPTNRRTLKLLVKRYATADDPRHPRGQFVNYRRILEDLGGAHGGSVPIDGISFAGDRRAGSRAEPVTAAAGTNQRSGCGDYCVGSRSVGDRDTLKAPSQLRVFGKPTDMSRTGHSPVRKVNMTSSLVLGRGRDRSVEELMSHLKAFAFRSSLRTMEFFRSDDPRRSGTMTRDTFGRCLLVMGFRFSPVELDNLCDAYPDESLQDGGGVPFVRYARLLKEVDSVFGVRDLERKPECDVNASVEAAKDFFASKTAASPAPGVSPLSAEENTVVVETLRELGVEVSRRRLSLYPVLHDFDRFNRGTIPGTAFERALSQVGILPGRIKTRLLRCKFTERFTSPDTRIDVNYKAFLAALDMVAAGHNQIPDQLLVGGASVDSVGEAHGCVDSVTDGKGGTNRSAEPVSATLDRIGDRACVVASGGGRGRSSSLQVVVREIARQLAVGWVDITDFMADSGRLKQEDVSLSKLKVVFALVGVSLTDEELQTLERGFKSDRSVDMVDWRRLAAAVTKAGGADTSAKAARNGGEVLLYPFVTFSATDEARTEAGHHQQRHDQDQSVAPKDDASDVGLRIHGSSCGRRDPVTVERRPNLAAVEDDAKAGETSGGGRGGERAGEEDDAVDREVLQRALDAIRHRVKHYRMHLKPSFQIFDKNRRRKITRPQFLSVLSNMNLNLTGREWEAICRKYTVHERSPGVRVLYDTFCDDVHPEDSGS